MCPVTLTEVIEVCNKAQNHWQRRVCVIEWHTVDPPPNSPVITATSLLWLLYSGTNKSSVNHFLM